MKGLKNFIGLIVTFIVLTFVGCFDGCSDPVLESAYKANYAASRGYFEELAPPAVKAGTFSADSYAQGEDMYNAWAQAIASMNGQPAPVVTPPAPAPVTAPAAPAAK